MTKKDIAVQLCSRIPQLSKSTALHVVDNVIEILTDAFSREEHVYLRGFGTMVVKSNKARKARNINAGKSMVIPAQRTVKFKISQQLKNRMNNGNKL